MKEHTEKDLPTYALLSQTSINGLILEIEEFMSKMSLEKKELFNTKIIELQGYLEKLKKIATENMNADAKNIIKQSGSLLNKLRSAVFEYQLQTSAREITLKELLELDIAQKNISTKTNTLVRSLDSFFASHKHQPEIINETLNQNFLKAKEIYNYLIARANSLTSSLRSALSYMSQQASHAYNVAAQEKNIFALPIQIMSSTITPATAHFQMNQIRETMEKLYAVADWLSQQHTLICQNQRSRVNIAWIMSKTYDWVMHDTFDSIIDGIVAIQPSQSPLLTTSFVVITQPIIAFNRSDERGRRFDFFRIYTSAENIATPYGATHDFVLMVPNNENRTLAELGFNESAWHGPLSETEISSHRKFYIAIEEPEATQGSSSLPPLDDVWLARIQHLFISGSFCTQKFIYLLGHGLPQTQVADLQMSIFKKYLQFLSTINTSFLWINSCYAGGLNLTLYQDILINTIKENIFDQVADQSKHIVKTPKINYPLVIESSTDSPTKPTGEIISISEIFEALKTQKFPLSHPHDLKEFMNKLFPQGFGDREGKTYLSNYPVIYVPGADFFRPVDISNSLIITTPVVQGLRIAPSIKHLYSKSAVKKDELVPTITIDEQKPLISTVLVYPQNLHEVQLNIKGRHLPPFLSEIPGPSHHIIHKIYAPYVDLADIGKQFFPTLNVTVRSRIEYPKAWFIEEIECKDKKRGGVVTFEGVVFYTIKYRGYRFGIQAKEYEYNAELCLILYKKLKVKKIIQDVGSSPESIHDNYQTLGEYEGRLTNQENFASGTVGRPGVKFLSLNEKSYYDTLRYIYFNTKASEDALYQSSGGLETAASQDEAFCDYIKKLQGCTIDCSDTGCQVLDEQSKKRIEKRLDKIYAKFDQSDLRPSLVTW